MRHPTDPHIISMRFRPCIVTLVALLLTLVVADAARAQSADQMNPAPWITTSSEEARHAFAAGFEAFLGFDNLRALEEMERAIAADPGLGVARAVQALLRQELSGSPEFTQAVADASGASAPEALLALALREWQAGRTPRARILAGALAETLAADPRMAVFHATFLPVETGVEALRELARVHAEVAAAHLWLAYRLTPATYGVLAPAGEREAVDAARTALRLSPRSAGSHLVLGRLLHRLGHYSEALEHVGHIVSMGPPLPEAHELAAEIHLQHGRLAEARGALESALVAARGNGQRFTYRRGLALLHLHEGNLEQSASAIGELAEEAEREGRRGSAGTSHRFLAAIHAASGDRERALHHLNEAWRVNPIRGTQANYAAMVHAWLGNVREARRALEEYVDAAGPEPTAAAQDYVHLITGQVLLAEGKPEAALEALALSGDNPYAQIARWEAYEALDRRQEADAERKDLLERMNFPLYSTGIPIARYRAHRR